jgi:DNA-binding winged helix-turn-helix (wHTH) protein/Tol biopolymer transport system component
VYKNGNASIIRFGTFEFRPGAGELRKHGIKIRLQGKPLQLLQALLERPGEVIAREELRDRLWAADTFVDFESGLNTAVNRLRFALGDSADHPRYIGTLARSGYQFLAPISEGHGADAGEEAAVVSPPPANERRKPFYGKRLPAAAAAGLLLASALQVWLHRSAPPPVFHQLTFRRFSIDAARFAPDGESVIYAAGELPGGRELYIVNTLSPESRPLGFQGSALASVSHSGELALVTYNDPKQSGLVRVPLNGGAPQPLDRGVCCADWSPDGSTMAVIRPGARHATLELPRGHVIYESAGWLSHIRISPSGKEVAFIEHPMRGDDAGDIKVIDAAGGSRAVAGGWASAWGLAWVPSGQELWFTAARSGALRSLHALSLTGKLRPATSFLGTLTLLDISRSGRVLISRDQTRMMMAGFMNGDAHEKDLSWFDFSRAADISDDGRVILFDETGEGGGTHHTVYVRRRDAPSAMRVGDGYAMALSPDGNAAVTMPDNDQTHLSLVPLTPGQPHTVSGHRLRFDWVRVFPGGHRLLAGGSLSAGPLRLFIQPLDGGEPQPVNTSVYLVQPAISPDGTMIAGVDANHRLVLLSSAGGEAKVIASGFEARVLRWSKSGKSLLVQSGPVPAKVLRVDVATGKSTPWKEIAPSDMAGVSGVFPALLSEDERTMVYSFRRNLSELFVVEGLVEGAASR